MKIIFFSLMLWFTTKAYTQVVSNSMQGQYNVMTFYINSSISNALKITTAIPFGNENMTSVYLKGYDYGNASTINIQVSWYANGSNFHNYTASSAGGLMPKVYLANENGYIIIYLERFISYTRFDISAYGNGFNENAAWYTNWVVADATVNSSSTLVDYVNDFGWLKAEDISTNNIYASTLTAGSGIINGKLGIGTLSPFSQLSLGSDTYTDGSSNKIRLFDDYASITSESNNSYGLGFRNWDGRLAYTAGNGGYHQFYTSNQARLTILSTGELGIGTITPQEKLHVNGNQLWTNGNRVVKMISSNTHVNSYNLQSYLYPLYINELGNNTILNEQGGDVGIGTSETRGFKLAVNGPAIFTKAVVKLYVNWPDYVFNRNYRLKSLKEVEKFIKVHKHLPGVPTAKEVQQKGIDVGDNQAILLKKIEELTLYLIELNKRIEGLEVKVKEKQASSKN